MGLELLSLRNISKMLVNATHTRHKWTIKPQPFIMKINPIRDPEIDGFNTEQPFLGGTDYIVGNGIGQSPHMKWVSLKIIPWCQSLCMFPPGIWVVESTFLIDIRKPPFTDHSPRKPRIFHRLLYSRLNPPQRNAAAVISGFIAQSNYRYIKHKPWLFWLKP